MQSHEEFFSWAPYPTAANPTGEGHFERLIGRDGIREILGQKSDGLGESIRAWTAAPEWRERVRPFLLYA